MALVKNVMTKKNIFFSLMCHQLAMKIGKQTFIRESCSEKMITCRIYEES